MKPRSHERRRHKRHPAKERRAEKPKDTPAKPTVQQDGPQQPLQPAPIGTEQK
jgi:hypothetical protein